MGYLEAAVSHRDAGPSRQSAIPTRYCTWKRGDDEAGVAHCITRNFEDRFDERVYSR
jgi:hypothetical protein